MGEPLLATNHSPLINKEKLQLSSVSSARRDLIQGLSNVDVSQVLRTWSNPEEAKKACFWQYNQGNPIPAELGGDIDYLRILNARPSKNNIKSVVILGYENPKGASGGVKAVTDRLPIELKNYLLSNPDYKFNPDIVRISPRHTNLLTKYEESKLELKGKCNVPFGGEIIETTIYQVDLNGSKWILFEAKGFFEADGGLGRTDPYIFSSENQIDRDGDNSNLLKDSLFASRAVPEILIKLKLTNDIIVHAQDWQFATAALTIKERVIEDRIRRAAVLLTIHNPYDHGLSEDNLSKISNRDKSYYWPKIEGQPRPTVLTRMIPLLDGPPSVVSHNFAQDLTTSPQQTGIYTGHQQGVFVYQKKVGIDNGNFISINKSPFSDVATEAARKGNPALIIEEKLALRKKLLVSLETYLAELEKNSDPNCPVYGKLFGSDRSTGLSTLSDDIPIFMMPGRLDPGQKGYDVVARVIESVPVGFGRFILTPMSPLANDPAVKPFMDDLIDLAKSREGEVVIIAHRMSSKEVYDNLLAGATWSLWPSLYEPFGGANEFYAMGTPVIAHAVGGLVQQVIGYHQDPQNATGFLYTEPTLGASMKELEEEYSAQHRAGPRERMHVGIYQRQVLSLAVTIAEAVAISKLRPDIYGNILANLYEMYKELSWEKPIKDYLAWYENTAY